MLHLAQSNGAVLNIVPEVVIWNTGGSKTESVINVVNQLPPDFAVRNVKELIGIHTAIPQHIVDTGETR